MNNPRIVYTQCRGTSPQDERDALCAVLKFVLFDSQANKGGSHDLTGDTTKECTARPDKKGTQNADLHGHGL